MAAKSVSAVAAGVHAVSAANYPPQTIVVYTQTAWTRFWSWIGWFGCFVLGIIAIGLLMTQDELDDDTSNVTEQYVQGDKDADDKIAVISIEGVIMEGDGFVKQQIDKVRKDKDVKAVVVRVDSPGGTVTGSDYIYHHLTRLRKERGLPMVVSMGGMAASGGYYVSMAVGDQPDSIFAEPTCSTGSIGVIIPHYDVSGLMARYDIKDDSIATHPRKQMLSMTREMPEEHREILQAHINDMFGRFKSIIKDGRPMFKEDAEALDKLATGEIFTAQQALENKLIDKIGFLEEAIERAAELASLNVEKTLVVEYERPITLLGELGGYSQAPGGSFSSANPTQLFELAAPRMWYLATSLPTILTARKAD
jgi:protease-4